MKGQNTFQVLRAKNFSYQEVADCVVANIKAIHLKTVALAQQVILNPDPARMLVYEIMASRFTSVGFLIGLIDLLESLS